ncbi:MAG: 50S ribosomal protein L3 [Phycisphaerales bacterium]|nr:50S ribosomal protein L3 [Planctomycetota bacterium]MCH8508735.1 50S ribosomal protein L3 [Phycisphaerales bacterium]
MTLSSSGAHLIGQKIGMTRVFDEKGVSVPVTVIQVGANVVTQVRSPDVDGYAAVQIGAGDIKPRNSTMPLIGHDAKAGSAPLRHHKEFRVPEKDLGNYELGQELTLGALEGVRFVDVIGTSKGKGFQGTMKRHNFKGQQASHGVERKHRSPGSIGGHATNRGHSGKLKKGKRMSGQMGNERVTVRSLDIVRIDAENNLLLVKGPVPGHNKAWVEIRPAIRLYKSKVQKG